MDKIATHSSEKATMAFHVAITRERNIILQIAIQENVTRIL